MSKTPFYRNPWVLGFVVGIVTITAMRPLLRRIPEPPPVLSQLPDYELVDTDGKPFGSRELRGTVYVASFFFSSCRSICPTIMRGVARLQDGFKKREIDGIRLVSISVDPAGDTPEVLRAYASSLHVDPARWTLLTGPPDKIRSIVVDGFKTPMDRKEATPAEPMDIAHTGKLVLVDWEGRVRGYYDADETGLDEVFNRAQHVVRQQRTGK